MYSVIIGDKTRWSEKVWISDLVTGARIDRRAVILLALSITLYPIRDWAGDERHCWWPVRHSIHGFCRCCWWCSMLTWLSPGEQMGRRGSFSYRVPVIVCDSVNQVVSRSVWSSSQVSVSVSLVISIFLLFFLVLDINDYSDVCWSVSVVPDSDLLLIILGNLCCVLLNSSCWSCHLGSFFFFFFLICLCMWVCGVVYVCVISVDCHSQCRLFNGWLLVDCLLYSERRPVIIVLNYIDRIVIGWVGLRSVI
jgi:hypothetical protein